MPAYPTPYPSPYRGGEWASAVATLYENLLSLLQLG